MLTQIRRTFHHELTLHNIHITLQPFKYGSPLFFAKLHLNGWSECATNFFNFFPLHTIKMSRISAFVVSLVFRFICRNDARCRHTDVIPQSLCLFHSLRKQPPHIGGYESRLFSQAICFTDISFVTIDLPRMIRLTRLRNLIEINAIWNRLSP